MKIAGRSKNVTRETITVNRGKMAYKKNEKKLMEYLQKIGKQRDTKQPDKFTKKVLPKPPSN